MMLKKTFAHLARRERRPSLLPPPVLAPPAGVLGVELRLPQAVLPREDAMAFLDALDRVTASA